MVDIILVKAGSMQRIAKWENVKLDEAMKIMAGAVKYAVDGQEVEMAVRAHDPRALRG